MLIAKVFQDGDGDFRCVWVVDEVRDPVLPECFVKGESEAVLPECRVEVFEDDIVMGVERPDDVVGFDGTLS